METLKKVHVLQTLSKSHLQRLADVLTEVVYEEGTKIITQGEMGETFYIIKEGHAICTKSDASDPTVENEIMKLAAGDYFGERALLELAPRAANVKAVKGKITCAEINKKSFEEVLGPLSRLIQEDREKREKAAYAVELVHKSQQQVWYFLPQTLFACTYNFPWNTNDEFKFCFS